MSIKKTKGEQVKGFYLLCVMLFSISAFAHQTYQTFRVETPSYRCEDSDVAREKAKQMIEDLVNNSEYQIPFSDLNITVLRHDYNDWRTGRYTCYSSYAYAVGTFVLNKQIKEVLITRKASASEYIHSKYRDPNPDKIEKAKIEVVRKAEKKVLESLEFRDCKGLQIIKERIDTPPIFTSKRVEPYYVLSTTFDVTYKCEKQSN